MTARRVVMFETMPEREPASLRIATLEADIRDAAAKARRKCEDYAQKYTVSGYSIDDEHWEMGVVGRTVSVAMRLVRPD